MQSPNHNQVNQAFKNLDTFSKKIFAAEWITDFSLLLQ